jgi:hypothetical protein
VHVDDEADAARVMLEARVVERRKLAVGHQRVPRRQNWAVSTGWNWPPPGRHWPEAEPSY